MRVTGVFPGNDPNGALTMIADTLPVNITLITPRLALLSGYKNRPALSQDRRRSCEHGRKSDHTFNKNREQLMQAVTVTGTSDYSSTNPYNPDYNRTLNADRNIKIAKPAGKFGRFLLAIFESRLIRQDC